ncbi:heterokaryon incompatibility protein-domain-containing protein [Dichotomopilus funicola]|uniref:Heterokaryon incompatibility protein-domain-containing protein n=1 Tax=Dichotomopilus funicola TaxID=1934379 RepID=A0AAN6ZJ98_9PEZI|nr:heterokaryon incompatibility protein-domain-containing protein [Dichotomopilus funicola]
MSQDSQYQPLDSSQQEIRILWLLPRTKEDDSTSVSEIQATLTTVSLSQKPAYNALSYTWGAPDDPVHRIRLNGRHFEVRSNLHDCLVHLRQSGIGSRESGVPLWIDAVCINQDDVPERNSQLPMMGDIYRRATSVISWLGSDDRLLKGTAALTEIVREWTRFKEGLRIITAPDGSDGSELAARRPVSNDQLQDWLQTHVCICGTASFAEADLDTLADCILTVFGEEKIDGVSDSIWTNVTLGIRGELGMRARLSAVQVGLAAPSLMFVLYISNTRASTDPRDVVYGLLHLIPDHGIVPGYRKAVWEVYADWAAKAMLQHGNMELLSYVTAKEECWTDVELDLPSWVPDTFNYKGYRQVEWLKRGGQENTEDGRDGGFSVELLKNGRVLKVDGRHRDTVRKVTQLRRFAESKQQWKLDMIRFCMDNLVAQRESGRSHPTGIPPLQALVRLVMQAKIAALSPDEYPKRVHEVACGFIGWLIFAFNNVFRAGAPPGEPLDIASSLLGLGLGEDFPEMYEEAVFPGVDVRELMGWNKLIDALPEAGVVTDYMINWCVGRS